MNSLMTEEPVKKTKRVDRRRRVNTVEPPTPEVVAERIESVRRLVWSLAGRFRGLGPDAATTRDDLYCAGMVGAWQASLRYDPDRGVKFASYGGDAAWRGMLRWWRTWSRRGYRGMDGKVSRLESVPLPVELDGMEDLGRLECLGVAGGTEQAEESEEEGRLLAALRKLDPRVRLVLERRYWDDAGLLEVGAEMGICKERVRQLQLLGLERLRDLMRVGEGEG